MQILTFLVVAFLVSGCAQTTIEVTKTGGVTAILKRSGKAVKDTTHDAAIAAANKACIKRGLQLADAEVPETWDDTLKSNFGDILDVPDAVKQLVGLLPTHTVTFHGQCEKKDNEN